MIVVAALLLAQADTAVMVARASAVTRPVTAAPARRKGDRWRIADDGEAGPDGKARAAAMTGVQCGVVGAKLCTRKLRTWLKAPLGR